MFSTLSEFRRIRNVDDTDESFVITDCPECHKEIRLNISIIEDANPFTNDIDSTECCSYVFRLEPAIELVVYRNKSV